MKLLILFLLLMQNSFSYANQENLQRQIDQESSDCKKYEVQVSNSYAGEAQEIASANLEHCLKELKSLTKNTESSGQNAGTTNNVAANSADSYGQNCTHETEEATNTSCNFSKNKDAQVALYMADQMRGQLKMMTMSSPAVLCSKMGAVSQAIDAAVAGFSSYCTTAYTSCERSCTEDIAELESVIKTSKAMQQSVSELETRLTVLKDAKKACSKLSGNVQNVMSNIGSYAQIEMAKSQYCSQKTDALAELCKSQPSNALCQKAGNADCSNPTTAASNLICICQINQADPRCIGQQKIGLNSSFNNTNSNSNGTTTDGENFNDGFGGPAGGDGSFGSAIAPGDLAGNDGSGGPPGSRGNQGGGRGGLDMSGSGQSGNRANNQASTTAGPADPASAKIINGYGLSGSAGSTYRGSSGLSYPSGAGAQPGNRGYMGGNKIGPSVDLRKFLPGGRMDPTRGLAGISGPDGITGPNSDIWKKVNSRYFNLQPSLLP